MTYKPKLRWKKLDCPICGIFMKKSRAFKSSYQCPMCKSVFMLRQPVSDWVKAHIRARL